MAANSTGHLFVTHGDLSKIAADHVIVPCDGDLRFTSSFAGLVGGPQQRRDGWFRRSDLAVPAGFATPTRDPLRIEGRGVPKVWLFNSAVSETTSQADSLTWLQSGLRSAFASIATATGKAANNRERPLIALPLVGVGDGGFSEIRGETIIGILATLNDIAARPGHPDIVLVTWRRSDYAAIQGKRGTLPLPPGVDENVVKNLVANARNRRLVAFMGAGVSQSAGLPSWKQLLEKLAAKAHMDEELKGSVLELAPEDSAEVLTRALGGPANTQSLVAGMMQADRYGLSHSLLASMRLREAVTTNYDNLYESACEQAHHPKLSVLPREAADGQGSWLVKLHGDVKKPDSIILSRSQYFAFDSTSAPMSSMVQAGMVTRHMMFVGYSVSDLNFIRLAHQVKQLFATYGNTAPVGTVFSIGDKPGPRKLWDGTLDYLVLPGDQPAGARKVEIVLDYVACQSCDEASYLLHDRYRGSGSNRPESNGYGQGFCDLESYSGK